MKVVIKKEDVKFLLTIVKEVENKIKPVPEKEKKP